EEIEALSSIYGDEWCVIDEASRIFCIKICSDSEEPKLTACLQIVLPCDYPSTSPPIYQINAAWLRGPERAKLANSLEDLYVEHMGECILYLWVEKVREFLVETSQSAETVDQPGKVNMTAEEDVEDGDNIPDIRTIRVSAKEPHLYADLANGTADLSPVLSLSECLKIAVLNSFFLLEKQCQLCSVDEEVPPIKHGESITDRRSTFQPHLAPVVTPGQVKKVLEELYENKKIASATHNIYAYRIYCEDKQSFLQDCDDDGETAAGGRLLHLLQILDVRNVLVVVSRWYGGILLGPDRFKHINNCARNILVEEGHAAS
ncbi:unnamed protein product, partial [Tetraodon nigroviridis]